MQNEYNLGFLLDLGNAVDSVLAPAFLAADVPEVALNVSDFPPGLIDKWATSPTG